MASVFELYAARDDLPRCAGCDGLGSLFDRWSPTMWHKCKMCLGSGTPAARDCPHCRNSGTSDRYPYFPESHAKVTCPFCHGWGYLLGGYLHPNLLKERK